MHIGHAAVFNQRAALLKHLLRFGRETDDHVSANRNCFIQYFKSDVYGEENLANFALPIP